MKIRRLVLDVLKPHEPGVIEYADKITELEGIDGLTLNVMEIDNKTQSVEICVEGDDVPYEDIRDVIESLGGSIHSVDQVSAGTRIILTTGKEMRLV